MAGANSLKPLQINPPITTAHDNLLTSIRPFLIGFESFGEGRKLFSGLVVFTNFPVRHKDQFWEKNRRGNLPFLQNFWEMIGQASRVVSAGLGPVVSRTLLIHPILFLNLPHQNLVLE